MSSKTLNETEYSKYYNRYKDMKIEWPKLFGSKYEGRPMSDDCYDYNSDYGKIKMNRRMSDVGQVNLPKLDKLPALETQVTGDYYTNMAIQPVEYITKNNLTFTESLVIKYVSRHRRKNGAEDIKKAIHTLQLILQLEYGQS